MNASILRLSLLLISLAISLSMAKAEKPINTTFTGLAIRGYDPVAYFIDGKPRKGLGKFTHEWKGAEWRFATDENRRKFIAEPTKYAPQYGGYCAWAVSQGYTANIDPEAWRIVEGKLYLNYNREVQSRWEKDIPGFIEKADKNWPGLLNK